MTYGYTSLATNFDQDRPKPLWIRFLYRILPLSNPDHEPHYPQVKRWLLELDDSGVPQREIGLNAEGHPLFGAPDDENFGFWTDSSEPFDPAAFELTTKAEFESYWDKAKQE